MQNRGLLKYKLHHFFFWILVFGLWYYLRYQDYITKQIAFQITLLKVSALAGAIYLTNYLLIPWLLYKKRYPGFVTAFIALIFISSGIKIFFMSKIMHDPAMLDFSKNLKTRFYENVISDFFLIMAGAAFKLIWDYSKMQQRLAEVGKEKAEAELNFLKSQINPHFLFNSLNSVYFLINKDNADARDALHKFSEMLRYQLYETNGDKIPVEKEIGYLRDYIDLQHLRKDEKFAVEFNCSAAVKEFSIQPLLLMPFVENAFKHVSHFGNRTNFIKIAMGSSSRAFTFSVENSKEKQYARTINGGIGLSNVRRRLELLYPGKHQLSINDSDDIYSVMLVLNIDN